MTAVLLGPALAVCPFLSLHGEWRYLQECDHFIGAGLQVHSSDCDILSCGFIPGQVHNHQIFKASACKRKHWSFSNAFGSTGRNSSAPSLQ